MARGRADDDSFDPNAFLSPLDRITEQQAFTNPLIYAGSGWGPLGRPQQPSDLGPSRQEDSEGNVLLAGPPPPIPLNQMPLEQQFAWHKRQADDLSQQASTASTLLSQKVTAKQQRDLLDKQNQLHNIADSLQDLDPSQDDYPLARTKLLAKNALVAGSNEAKDLLASHDEIYKNKRELGEALTKADREAKTKRDDARLTKAYDLAQKAGPEVLARFNELVATNPDQAMHAVSGLILESEKGSTVAQLQGLGMDQDEINQRFQKVPGQMFDFASARNFISEKTKEYARQGDEDKRDIDIHQNMMAKKTASDAADNANPVIAVRVANWRTYQGLKSELASPNISEDRKKVIMPQIATMEAKPDDMMPPRWTPADEARLERAGQIADRAQARMEIRSARPAIPRGGYKPLGSTAFDVPAEPTVGADTLPTATPATATATPTPTPAPPPVATAGAAPRTAVPTGTYGASQSAGYPAVTNVPVGNVPSTPTPPAPVATPTPRPVSATPVPGRREDAAGYPDNTILRFNDGKRYIKRGGKFELYKPGGK